MGIRLDNAKALYLEGIRDGEYRDAIAKYSGDRYTQHSTPVKDGQEGFVDFFADFVERNPDRDIEIVRGFEDDRFVFLHAVQRLNGGTSRWVTADIFDTDDHGKLIEHWDIIEEWGEESVSGHTQIDGPTEPRDLEKTGANKALVARFIADVLSTGQLDGLTDYVSAETYVQHNPRIADGVEGMYAFYDSLAREGNSIVYREVHNIVGCGDFVAVLAKVSHAGTEMAVIDLYRVANGRIVEHWDVSEEILPEDQWVNSGKF